MYLKKLLNQHSIYTLLPLYHTPPFIQIVNYNYKLNIYKMIWLLEVVSLSFRIYIKNSGDATT